MPKIKLNPCLMKTGAEFNPGTDIPLRYFSVKKTFVRNNTPGNYKLFCGQNIVIFLQHDGFIYKYPSYTPQHEPYVEAFIQDYAPHVSYHKVNTALSIHKPLYIGLPEPATA